MSKIMKEISKLTGTGLLDRGEDAQEYMKRMLSDANKMSDDEWDRLSPEAQLWINDAQKAENDGVEIPVFPDVLKPINEAVDKMSEEEALDDLKNAVNSEDEKPAKPKKKTTSSTKGKSTTPPTKKKPSMTAKKKPSDAPAKKAPTKNDKPKKASSKPGIIRREAGAQDFIKQEIMRNPHITREELHEKVKKKGFKVSSLTVSTLRSGFRNSLKIIRDAGHLKGIDI